MDYLSPQHMAAWPLVARFLPWRDVLSLRASCPQLRPLFHMARYDCLVIEKFRRKLIRRLLCSLAARLAHENGKPLDKEYNQVLLHQAPRAITSKLHWKFLPAPEGMAKNISLPFGIYYGMSIVTKPKFNVKEPQISLMCNGIEIFTYNLKATNLDILQSPDKKIIPLPWFFYNLPLYMTFNWTWLVANFNIEGILLYYEEKSLPFTDRNIKQPVCYKKGFGVLGYGATITPHHLERIAGSDITLLYRVKRILRNNLQKKQ